MTIADALDEWWGYPPDFDEGMPFVLALLKDNQLMLWKDMHQGNELSSVVFHGEDIYGSVTVDRFGVGVRVPANGPIEWLYTGGLASVVTVIGGNDLTLNFDPVSVEAIEVMLKGHYSKSHP